MSIPAPARTYLVGGAVRDELLGLEPRERDWVVTGSSPEVMIELGFRQVGASFPVFIHPRNGEEYALARTERKQGHGYHGFSVDFHPGVTLEQDLERRDLTVNAMARDEDGVLIDPFGGREDLERRVLRHVSSAFVEDPLRVLRVARFAATLAPLGFVIHDSTMALMRRIVEDGEIEHLVPERSWAEIARALEAPVPSRFVESLRECGALAVILPEVDRLFGVPQNERYHPEIDTGAHTMMALDLAAHEGHPPSVGFAVLLHDLGKGLTPESAWPSHRGHEERGLPLVAGVCERLRVPSAWRDLAHAVCREHLRLHRLESMRPGTILSLIESVDLLRRPDRLEPFIQACEADYRGRKGWSDRPYPQGERLSHALKAAGAVRAADLDLEGLDGLQIAERVRQARIAAIVESAAAHPPD